MIDWWIGYVTITVVITNIVQIMAGGNITITAGGNVNIEKSIILT